MPVVNFTDPASDAVNAGVVNAFWANSFGAIGTEENRIAGTGAQVFQQAADVYRPQVVDFNALNLRLLVNRYAKLGRTLGKPIRRLKYRDQVSFDLSTLNAGNFSGEGTDGAFLVQVVFTWGANQAVATYRNVYFQFNAGASTGSYRRMDSGSFIIPDPNDAIVPIALPFSASLDLTLEFTWNQPGQKYILTVNGGPSYDLLPFLVDPEYVIADGAEKVEVFAYRLDGGEVEAGLGAPTILAPGELEEIPVENPFLFDWTDVVGATSYDFQIALDPGFVGLLLDDIGLEVSEASVGDLSFGGEVVPIQTLWCRARGVDGGGPGPWSATREFIVSFMPPP